MRGTQVFALWAMGLQKDDKVAVISNNRPEWNMLDVGMLQIGDRERADLSHA